MTIAFSFLSGSTTQGLVWTLVHSLWQSMLCLAAVWALLRIIPSRFATFRYWTAIAGLVATVVMSVATYSYVSQIPVTPPTAVAERAMFQTVAYHAEPAAPASDKVLNSIQLLIQTNASWILFVWAIGAVFFSIRTVGGWWYLRRLQDQAIAPGDEWQARVQALASKMGIHRAIQLLESARIQTPLVVGFLKPIILIPIGMMAGLSTAQIESIFIHELMHIRRSDYVINILQSIVEAIYFFNPSVWIISGMIRNERENCCDDAVVAQQGNPLAYAHALASLEEARLTRSGLALSLADDNKQLLNRIRRIMEKSAHRYSNRERIVPIVLLAVGLFCASWISIQTGKSADTTVNPKSEATQKADTLKKENSSRYYQRRVITTDADGNPVEEIIEEYDGDEQLRPVIEKVMIQPLVPHPLAQLEAIDIVVPPFGPIDFTMDTIPPPGMFPGYWENFSREFERSIQEDFGEFFNEHEEKIRLMMQKIEDRLGDQYQEELAIKFEKLAEAQQQLAQIQYAEIDKAAAMASQQASMERLNEQLSHLGEMRQELMHIDQLRAMEMEQLRVNMKALEDAFKKVEQELNQELIKDGYVQPGEKLEIQFHDDDLRVNGKKIKPEHVDKYRAIMKKYHHEDFHVTPRGRME